MIDHVHNTPLPLEGGGAGVGVTLISTKRASHSPHPLTPSPSRGGGAESAP